MPWLTGWAHRKEIRYGSTIPGDDLDDFPLLIVTNGDADIAAELSDGNGITVTLADGETQVPFGLYPTSSPAVGTLILRARFDLSSLAVEDDVIGYLYYDDAETTTEDKAGVVSNGYVLFMPLEEDPSGSAPQMYDWVSESNVGTSGADMESGDLVAGQVGNGLDFDGSNDYITCGTGASLNGTVEFTRSVLVSTNDADTSCLLSQRGPGQYNGGYVVVMQPSGVVRFWLFGDWEFQFDITTSTTINDGDWHHVAVTRSTTGAAIYIDGVSAATSTSSAKNLDNTIPTVMGGDIRDDADYLAGLLDEHRMVSGIARTADWLAYESENELSNADTVTLGPEESEGGGVYTDGNFAFFMGA